MKISEIITDKYKLRIPPTVYYELLTDVREVEKENEPTTKNDLGVDCISRQEVLRLLANSIGKTNTYLQTKVLKMSSVTPQNQVYPLCEDCHTKMDEVRRAYDNAMKQEPILDKLRAEITTLQNRCYALTRGTMCAFCRYECKYKLESEG